MANLYGVLLIIVLIAASGVIAYVGDIVGRRMGRKRLSLFGMRPRHTAIAISVAAGMLITMFTLAVAMTASQDVRQGLLNVVEMRKQQARLARTVREAEKRVKFLDRSRQEAERRTLEAKAAAAAAQRSRQVAETKAAQAEAKATEAEAKRVKAEAARKAADESVANATKLVTRLTWSAEELRRRRDEAAGARIEERATPILVGAGQPLDAELVQGGQSKPAIRAQLNELLARVSAKARRAGAAPAPGSGDVVVLGKWISDPKTGKVVEFSEQQVLVAVTDTISRARGAVIARAESAINSYAGEPIYVDIRLYNNRLVYHKGEVLADAVVDGNQPEPKLMNTLVGVLKSQVGPDAKRKNMMPRISATGSDPFSSSASSVGEMSYDQLFDKIRELRQIDGPARVSVFAAQDAWTIGPLQVDMRIEPVRG